MRAGLDLFLMAPTFWVGALCTALLIGWVLHDPGEKRSANPWSHNYDPSLNSTPSDGTVTVSVPAIKVDRTDADGVTHFQD